MGYREFFWVSLVVSTLLVGCQASFSGAPGGGLQSGPPGAVNFVIDAPNGSVTVSPQKDHYFVGDQIQISAKGNDGFYFLHWEGDATDRINANREMTITGDVSLKALFFNPMAQNQFYVSPTGSSAGDGSIGAPWDLHTALAHPTAVKPGDIIWLRGGSYIGRFKSKLTGSDLKPIVVRGYPGERAVVDGNVVPATWILNTELPENGPSQPVTFVDNNGPATGESIKMGNETLNVYGRNGNNFYVARGWNGTPKELHPVGSVGTRILANYNIIDIEGANAWFWDIEFTDTDTNRDSAESGSHPEEITRGGVYVPGTRIKVINCYIHDLSNGLASQSGGEEFESYGNIYLNNGWNAPDRGHGHGIYTQNKTEKVKIYRDNVILPNFGLGLQQYGSDQADLNHFIWDGNTFALDRILFGGSKAYRDIRFVNNDSFGTGPEFGYNANGNTDAVIKDNYLDGINIKYFTRVEAKRNILFRSAFRGGVGSSFSMYSPTPDTYDYSTNDMDWNEVYSNNTSGNVHRVFTGPRASGLTLAAWQALTGYETNGKVYTTARPSEIKVVVKPNAYDKNLAYVSIFNWPNASSVIVNLTGFLQNGDSYEIRSLLNYDGEVQTGTYSSASKLLVPMLGRSIVAPIGWASPLANAPFPEFGIFQIRRQ